MRQLVLSGRAVPAHLQDGDEFTTPLSRLLRYGELLFNAKFTVQDGAGRPLSKGTGAPLSDLSSPLLFPRNFDRLSSPEANACSGCHNARTAAEVAIASQRFSFWRSGLTGLCLTTVTVLHCEEPSMNLAVLSRWRTRRMSEKRLA